MDLVRFSTHAFVYYALVLARVASVVTVVPFIGGVAVPNKVKIFLPGALALVLMPAVYDPAALLPMVPVAMTIAIVREVAVGVIIGFAVTLIFMALQLAGRLVGQVMGLGLANVINPFSESQVSVIGQFFFFLGILIFLGIRGHHFLIEGLAKTFATIPLGAAVFNAGIIDVLLDLFQDSFVLAIKVASPMIVALFVTMLALGFIARTVPQLNILIVGFPLSIMVGLVLIGISLGSIAFLLENETAGLYGTIEEIIRLLSPAGVQTGL